MKTKSKLCLVFATVGTVLSIVSSASAQTPILRLQASGYDAATGTWTATNGSNATQPTAGNRPTLVTGQTANGSSVVRFDGSDFLNLVAAIATGNTSSFTAFVYLRPTDTATPKTIIGGTNNTLQYRVNADERQEALKLNQTNLGTGSTAMPSGPTASFSSINVTVSNSGGDFRLNGVANGTTTAPPSGFDGSITRIGARDGFPDSEFFAGDIAEIRIYSGVLTLTQRQTIENELVSSYGAVPEPHEYAVAMGVLLLAAIFIRRQRLHRLAA